MVSFLWVPKAPGPLPSRWDHAAAPATKVIHLDQWCYNALAADKAGKPRKDDEAGCYEYFRRLALSGQVVFVLSWSHYQENGVRTAMDARWDTAVVMAELSGFNTITAKGVAEWEALVAVASVAGDGVAIEPPVVFGWGYHHCHHRKEVVLRGVAPVTGRPLAREDELGIEAAARQAPVGEDAIQAELTLLARWNPNLEGQLEFGPLPPSDYGKRHNDEEARIESMLDGLERRPAVVRAAVEAVHLTDPSMSQHLKDASERLGVGADAVMDAIVPSSALKASSVDPKVLKRSRKTLRRFTAVMPVQGRFCELRVQAHLARGRNRITSDVFDYVQIATVSPFVNYMVVDSYMADLSMRARLNDRAGAMVLGTLADLRRILEREMPS